MQGRFLEYWYERGALYYNGFPLTPEFTETLEDGKSYTVQYFERVRLEYHPENQPPYDVLLGQFGRRVYPAEPPVPQKANALYFPQTGHNVESPFATYLVGPTSQSPIGIEYFGYPISEAFGERFEDGNFYTVQYFERARLELHPDGRVLLAQFGRRFLPTQVPPPSSPPAPSFRPGWLDRPPISTWNQAGTPIPLAAATIRFRESYCPRLLTGYSPELQAVIAAGWQTPIEPTIKGDVAIVLGSAGADEMCRPLQYQAFVFVRGRFAGLLSPILMNARTDEALASVTISDDGRTITALYTRYNGTEPPCCPSRISTLPFSVDPNLPLVTPGTVSTQPAP